MLTMEIDARDCEIIGNDFIYEMSTAFTIFYLGYKHNKTGVYPPYIDVKGNAVKRFDRKAFTGGFDIYVCDEWRLLIKYRKNGKENWR